MAKRTLGTVAMDLRTANGIIRRATWSAQALGMSRDDTIADLSQAVVLLNRATARFDSSCGLEDPVPTLPDKSK